MLKKSLSFFLLLILLVGCQSSSEEDFVFPEAKFSYTPTSAKVNEPINFMVKIIAGDKVVEDAEVRFEIWMDGQADNEHEMITINHQGEGAYSLDKSFEVPGTYQMYYHADALGIHMMEKYEFTITE